MKDLENNYLAELVVAIDDLGGRVNLVGLCQGGWMSAMIAAPLWVTTPPPQRPSLRSGLFCPGPSSLNRPHPPHSQAHRIFPAWRLIRDAFAVRERRGDPRVVPGFHCSFLPGMPSSPTPAVHYRVRGPTQSGLP